MSATPVEFTRLPLTSACPVPVTPDGDTCGPGGEPLSMDFRTELCAVDACWMIDAQRTCDFHLRLLFDQGCFGDDTYEGLCEEAYGEYGEAAVREAVSRSLVPWTDRYRYPQDEAQDWATSAKAHGLA